MILGIRRRIGEFLRVPNPRVRLLEGEKLEEEGDGRMRRGFHSKLFILSLYLCFSLSSWLEILFQVCF